MINLLIMKVATQAISIAFLSLATTLFSCTHSTEKTDVVSGATIPHDLIVLPPTNSYYRVLGHLEGLNNHIVKYNDNFYRGGQIYIEDLAVEALSECKIKTIISITPTDAERAFCASNGFFLIEIPFENKVGPTPKDYQHYAAALKNGKGPFYIHCKGGSHRAGILSAAYRIQFQDWSFDQALIEYGRLGGDLKTDHAMLQTLHRIHPEDTP